MPAKSSGAARLKEEFHEVEVPGAPESGIHGHDRRSGQIRTIAFWAAKLRCPFFK
jgi:hypothetical protein